MSNKTLVTIGGIILSTLVLVYMYFGTIDPCGILKQQLYNEFVKQNITETSIKDRGLQTSLSNMIVRPMINAMIDPLTPMQCMRGIYKLQTEGIDLKE